MKYGSKPYILHAVQLQGWRTIHKGQSSIILLPGSWFLDPGWFGSLQFSNSCTDERCTTVGMAKGGANLELGLHPHSGSAAAA